ncbi:hypothetical protein SAMN06265222_110209 [Neorhodopirellula lusitana]|uniref:Uncharacterized protein n=1 Tax=Neorhodopirellula lusitana TaxID=445327 RepID=A0ABY1QGE5_9BACT|nr:hypothetical protein SAMN06265222_110209 [Neorhodopirellula lusitana]
MMLVARSVFNLHTVFDLHAMFNLHTVLNLYAMSDARLHGQGKLYSWLVRTEKSAKAA